MKLVAIHVSVAFVVNDVEDLNNLVIELTDRTLKPLQELANVHEVQPVDAAVYEWDSATGIGGELSR